MKKESKTLVNTRRLVVSAILSAVSFVIMYLGTLTGVMDLCAVVVGAVCCAFAVIELSGIWPWLVCAVTSVLCLVLLPDKFCALEYVALGGIYPILKSLFERLPAAVSWTLKAIAFNLLLTACLVVGKFIFGLKDEWVAFNIVVYLLGNITFFIFDIALTTFISYYFKRLRGKLKIRF